MANFWSWFVLAWLRPTVTCTAAINVGLLNNTSLSFPQVLVDATEVITLQFAKLVAYIARLINFNSIVAGIAHKGWGEAGAGAVNNRTVMGWDLALGIFHHHRLVS